MRKTLCAAVVVIGFLIPLGYLPAQNAVERGAESRSKKLLSEFVAATKDQLQQFVIR